MKWVFFSLLQQRSFLIAIEKYKWNESPESKFINIHYYDKYTELMKAIRIFQYIKFIFSFLKINKINMVYVFERWMPTIGSVRSARPESPARPDLGPVYLPRSSRVATATNLSVFLANAMSLSSPFFRFPISSVEFTVLISDPFLQAP